MDQWFTTEKIDNTTYAISEYGHWEQVHSYLLLGNKKAVLVDTGLGIGNIKSEVANLTKLPIVVLTTHCHWDHIGGHKHFNDIRIHKLDSDWMINGIPVPTEQIRKTLISKPFTKNLPKEFNISSYIPFTGKPTSLLEGEDLIDLGNRVLKIIHTPGHSPGHICVLDKTNDYILTGDLIYKGKLDCYYESTDTNDFFNSVEKVSKIPNIKKVLPGHYYLNLPANFIGEVYEGLKQIKEGNQLHHGSGIHKFKHFEMHL